MKRDIDALAARPFDLLVIGCGIHGVSVARDAALRGLRVAAIDQGDVSGATSHNSLKTIHGGIRYLQHLDFRRARESINEQRYLLRTAPHLVRPLPFLMPTYGQGLRGPLAMFAGIRLYELLGLDRNRHLRGASRLGRGRVLSRAECLRRAPGIREEGLSGAALWNDAQVTHADRAAIQILQHASVHGAIVANHVRAERLTIEDARVSGAVATDLASGREIRIEAREVVCALGPWASSWLREGEAGGARLDVPLTRSMNLVTRRAAMPSAIGVQSAQASDSKLGATKRLFFTVPWNGRTVVGTAHVPHRADEPTAPIDDAAVASFVDEMNAAWPSLALTLEDVLYCYQGLTPAADDAGDKATRLHESRVVDHALEGGPAGLTSIVSIKWTTARLIAERAVDVVCGRLGTGGACRTRSTPIPDDPSLRYSTRGLDEEAIGDYCRAHIEGSLALGLDDMLLRRNDDLVGGYMSFEELRGIARAMGEALGWDETTRRQQLERLRARWLPATLRERLGHDEIWGESR